MIFASRLSFGKYYVIFPAIHPYSAEYSAVMRLLYNQKDLCPAKYTPDKGLIPRLESAAQPGASGAA